MVELSEAFTAVAAVAGLSCIDKYIVGCCFAEVAGCRCDLDNVKAYAEAQGEVCRLSAVDVVFADDEQGSIVNGVVEEVIVAKGSI